MIYSVILAGGSGRRFWPVSRECYPKQFLSIVGDKPLIQQTRDRVKEISPSDYVRVVTTSILVPIVTSLGFNKENVIIEPEGKNTLYAIALAAARILSTDKDALMLVLPSDHWIKNTAKFISVIKEGIPWANKGYLVTFGIIPNRLETGYGYIEKGKSMDHNILQVERFTEKPNVKTAKRYLKSGSFLWNSGIFLWRVDRILEEIIENQPHLESVLTTLIKEPSEDNVKGFYNTGAPISIDYGVLERSDRVLVVVADFKWDDIGSWNSLERIFPEDDIGNIRNGETYSINSKNNIFYSSDDGIIVAKGLENMIVVHTKNATLIFPKSEAQKVKDIALHIEQKYR